MANRHEHGTHRHRNTALFRFYEELNDFLPHSLRKRDHPYLFSGSPSVKDAIEAQGVPHTEVDLILVNGEPVDFAHRIAHGERVSVYPVFESLDIGGITRLRPEPLRIPSFVLDVHLGRLARYLRLLGFDTMYGNDLDDHQIVRIAADEWRIILTRDRGLLKHGTVTRGYWIRATVPRMQTVEVVGRFDLTGRIRPFTRCMVCNGITHNIDKHVILHMLERDTAERYQHFAQCGSCGRVYWEGTHHARLCGLIGDIMAQACR